MRLVWCATNAILFFFFFSGVSKSPLEDSARVVVSDDDFCEVKIYPIEKTRVKRGDTPHAHGSSAHGESCADDIAAAQTKKNDVDEYAEDDEEEEEEEEEGKTTASRERGTEMMTMR